MGKTGSLAYGVICYAVFFLSFLYLIGFLANLIVPVTVDVSSRPELPMVQAIAINLALIALFGAPHTLMARPWFKEGWTKIVPKEIERSTYVLVSTILLVILFWQWRPIPKAIWFIESGPLYVGLLGVSLLGYGIVLASTFMIDHFDLFGLRQVYLHWQGKEYKHHPFMVPFFYKFVRHPLYVGWLLAFWVTPQMTIGHLTFAAGCSVYIFIAIVFEERDLLHFLGDDYKQWRESTPMIIPFSKGGGAG